MVALKNTFILKYLFMEQVCKIENFLKQDD